MKLLTQEIIKSLPKLYETENDINSMVRCKFFLPGTRWTWYLIEFDGKDLMYGYVVGLEKELGYFSLSELEEIRGPMYMEVERDVFFKPKPLSEIK